MERTRIEVETIGFYHRGADLTAEPDFPPQQLNSNRKYFSNNQPIPKINLNLKHSIPDIAENNIESLLDYIRQKGYPNGQKPDFVTFKQLLIYVACSSNSIIYVVRRGGVLFMAKPNKKEGNIPRIDKNAVFKNFFIKAPYDGTMSKEVLKATVPGGYSILYSGVVSAIDKSNRSYVFTIPEDGIESLRNLPLGRYMYWKLVFGNTSSLIIGVESSNHSNDVRKIETDCYVEKIQKVDQKDFWKTISLRSQQHVIDDGEKKIEEFLRLVKNTVTVDGDCFVFSKNARDLEWKVERNEEEVKEFRDVVFKMVSDN